MAVGGEPLYPSQLLVSMILRRRLDIHLRLAARARSGNHDKRLSGVAAGASVVRSVHPVVNVHNNPCGSRREGENVYWSMDS